jgi:lipoate---protein ligase
MKRLDLTCPTPELNLACDEALLDGCEAGEGQETLRFWEADRPFLVLGHGNRVRAEVDVAACGALGVPILRRCSGGGTILQGPGCLNYALILRIDSASELQNVTRTNAFVMEQHRSALASLLPEPVSVQGVTDLTVGGRKVSGNAQRRRRRFLLFHGIFLLGLDLDLLEQVLPIPRRQPAYRSNRPHREFLRTLPTAAGRVKQALERVWSAEDPLETLPTSRIEALARERYASAAWTFKF